MTKKEFLSKLRRKICRLPHKEISGRLGFYNEIIDDKIEEGIPEKEAVAGVGNIEDIAAQILSDANVELKNQKKAINPWQIILLIVGSPIWLPILISVLAVVWSVIIAFWAVEIPFMIIGFIAKYLGIVCVALSKFAGKMTKSCVQGIGRLFGA